MSRIRGRSIGGTSGTTLTISSDRILFTATGAVAQLGSNLSSAVFSESPDVGNISVDAAGVVTLATQLGLLGTRVLNAVVTGISPATGLPTVLSVQFTLTGVDAAPVNSVLPVITGTTTEGQTLSVSTGTWSGSPTFGYQWSRAGISIGGATAATYLLAGADVGALIACTVTATNSGGAVSAAAAAVGPVVADSGVATPPALPNRDFFQFGDSRTEEGIQATLSGTGYSPRGVVLGPTNWLGAATGNKLRPGRYANFGVSASNSSQSAANPRRPAGTEPPPLAPTAGGWWRGTPSTSSGSDNKGSLIAATHSAGIGILLCFTNDRATGDFATSWANAQSILDNTPDKVWIVLNETATNLNDAGGVQGSVASADFKAFSDRLLTLDYASGHPDSRPNVIAVDTFALTYDVSSGGLYRNIVGALRDGLHFTPAYARFVMELVNSRMSAIYGAAWDALPSWALMPTANGLVTPADSQPFIHTNPILTPGTNGTVGVTWATPPAASGVPQGWTIGASSTSGGFVGVCTKGTETDGAGNDVWIIEISGTLAANSSGLVTVSQVLNSTPLTSAFAAGRVSINDAFRARCKMKIAPGSQLLTSHTCQATVQSTVATKTQIAITGAGSIIAPGNYVGNGANSNTIDAWQEDKWLEFVTELIDQQDPNMVAAGLNIASNAEISFYQYASVFTFRNNTAGVLPVSATIRLAVAGMYRCTGDQLH